MGKGKPSEEQNRSKTMRHRSVAMAALLFCPIDSFEPVMDSFAEGTGPLRGQGYCSRMPKLR